MPRLFVANLTFESEVAGHRQELPKRLRRLCGELVPLWLAAADEEDWLWCPEPIEASFWTEMRRRGLPGVKTCGPDCAPPHELELTPWGWSREVREFGSRPSAACNAPPERVVRDLNSRSFSFRLEQEWDCGPSEVVAVSSLSQFEAALRNLESLDRWVVKGEFSAAARDRVLGRGSQSDAHSLKWIRRRLAEGETLYWEPWLDRVEEAGIQWEIPVAGEPRLVGIAPLLCDEAGRYAGSGFGEEADCMERWHDAVEISRRAAERIQQAGYFGPLGIDAMRYRDADGELRLRPLQDVNARWTMGRIALGWRRIASGGVWRHGTREQRADAERHSTIIRTSPDVMGSDAVLHCTWIEPRAPGPMGPA